MNQIEGIGLATNPWPILLDHFRQGRYRDVAS